MNPKSAIAKGKALENHVCELLRAKGLDPKAYRSHGSGNGNTEKADIWTSLTILGRNVGFECKNHAVPHIRDWWEQTQKLEKLGREPVLVYKLTGENMGEAKVVIYLETFLDLIEQTKIRGEIIVDDSVDAKKSTWNLKQAKDYISKAINILKKEE